MLMFTSTTDIVTEVEEDMVMHMVDTVIVMEDMVIHTGHKESQLLKREQNIEPACPLSGSMR